MTIALIGGGEFTEACRFDADLLEASGTSEVLVVATASAYEHPDKLIERAVAHFAALGATVTSLDAVRRTDATDPAMVAVVDSARFVYLTDGSSMHLRSVLKDTPLWDAIAKVAGRGVVAASGAAAMLVTDPMYDPRGGAFTLGLGLISPLTVMPAHETWSPERSTRTRSLAPAHVPVISLDTTAAVIRQDGTWTAHGNVAVYLDGRPAELASLPR
jgi:cyanophycinase